ncbi:FAD-dependent monooxygenase [Streptomyces griseorubiginosus]|uniref:FAD-dependent monooxygenase n=1 Tax=Streptomyces griseorubiginosus TaxID=67304 RepID=UPI001AD64743|nr:FAD-dependent monooxygenase [Streptomyces griseorubiginosus]MBO4256971.1 pentachlorophenol monooxygenase [Streptomyces griseorubiginosus]
MGNERRSVVVIGNGPVGQTAALLLARWGIPVTIVDARPVRELVGSKAVTHRPNVLDIWEGLGAGRQMVEEGQAKVLGHVYYEDRELFVESYNDTGPSEYPAMLTLSQARIEALLDEQIARQPLIKVRWGHRMKRISQDGTGVALECVRPDGSRVTVTADYAVAALGARTRDLHEQLGVSFDGRTFADRFLICDIKVEDSPWGRDRHFHFNSVHNPGRQILIQPCPESTFRIDWQLGDDYDEADDAAGGFDARMRALIGDARYEVIWKSVYRFHARLASRMRVGRVLLAGDCAHLMAPFGGRGLNSGVCDAENAAWKLAYVLNGWAGEELLESYDLERRAAARENLQVTSTTTDFLVPQDDEQRERRRRLLEAARLDPSEETRGAIDTSTMAAPFWYVDSPLTTPQPRRPFLGRPAKGEVPRPGPGVVLPQVRVSVPGASNTRLRELARRGLLLLVGDAVEADQLLTEVSGAVAGPVEIYSIAAIDTTRALAAELEPAPDEVWVVRPDAHVAAVCSRADIHEVLAAATRAVGGTEGIRRASPWTRRAL